jgi:excinuclease ABC subunit A
MELHIKGAREHNLKNLELRIPRGKLIVITGVSGSGKSSLAFDTIYAEGYRKYIESLSTKARQILEQVKRPDVDFIHGLSPVVAIEQRTGGGSPRSTVATVTEIADYARLLWTVEGERFCPKDGGRIEKRSLDDNVRRIFQEPSGSRLILLAPFIHAKTSILRDELPRLRQRGFQRIRLDGEIRSLDEHQLLLTGKGEHAVEVVIDRIVLAEDQASRVADSLELAFREGANRAVAMFQDEKDSPWREVPLSQDLACTLCGDTFEPLTPRHFSFNHSEGACQHCGGIGQEMRFAEALIVPDPAKSVKQGAIKPWRIGGKALIIRQSSMLKQLAEQIPFDPNVPWRDLDPDVHRILIHGGGDRRFAIKVGRGKKAAVEKAFPGVLAELERAKAETKSEGFRARLTTYQTSQLCTACQGGRLNPASSHVLVGQKSLPDFFGADIASASRFLRDLQAKPDRPEGVTEVLHGLAERISFLREVGLDYLSLQREYGTLSGGESQRVRLATQLGMGLVGVIYVLDEPSIGLHPHDNQRLLQTLRTLRERGNTVIVVEHDEETMRMADHLIEIGPGAGPEGGRILFQGTPAECERDPASRTGPFLARELSIYAEGQRLAPSKRFLTVHGATENNLCDIDVRFPVGLMTCVTGVSGSGKSSLVNDVLARAAAFQLNRAKAIPGRHRKITGWEHFSRVVEVDQSPIGRSPRSNPATFVKLFDLLREVYSKTPLARVRGYKPARFSFNVRGGRCERCQGDGAIKLDMQFLADVYTECPSCRGKRYNRETLEVLFKGYSIADVLGMTVREALELFRNIPKVVEKLETLAAVGLDYLQLGQAAPSLSGGEAQRLKLSLELSKRQRGETLYILDEPTTGLHWIDIQKLMDLLFKLRDAGNTILIIEHNLDVVNVADWVIDLGPDGGTGGGQLLFAGPPDQIAAVKESKTGQAILKWQQMMQ